jgi:hypothetical protein
VRFKDSTAFVARDRWLRAATPNPRNAEENDPYGPTKIVSLLIPLPMGAGLNAVTVRPRAMQRTVTKPNFDMVISS